MKQDARFLKTVEEKIARLNKIVKGSVKIFIISFILYCMNSEKIFQSLTLNIVVTIFFISLTIFIGIIASKCNNVKECKEILLDIIDAFPLGEKISKKFIRDPNDEYFLYGISSCYEKEDGNVEISIEQSESDYRVSLVFHKENERDFKSTFECYNLEEIKRLKKFLFH